MKQRNFNHKIPDIKAMRVITMFLGRLGLNTCRTHNLPPPHPWTYNANYREWSYGLGLKEAKDLVERMWDYSPPAPPLQQLQMTNIYHCIKRTRQVMNMLNKLGLKTPDAGLRACKEFVTRRNR